MKMPPERDKVGGWERRQEHAQSIAELIWTWIHQQHYEKTHVHWVSAEKGGLGV